MKSVRLPVCVVGVRGLLCGVLLVLAFVGGKFFARKQLVVEKQEVPVVVEEGGVRLHTSKGYVSAGEAVEQQCSLLWQLQEVVQQSGGVQGGSNLPEKEFVRVGERFYELRLSAHLGWWSLLPALVAVVLCFVLREPVLALGGGVLAGALVMGRYDVAGEVIVPALGTATGATLVVLYLLLLGGLLGLWSRTGAAEEFARWVTQHFVRGPCSAKFVAWLLGVVFFQGGTLSAVLVGTTARPVADKQRVSHEELSYVVDSTASPVAVLLPFNAWPVYVQSFLFVSGVPFLLTEADRIGFFFRCIPLYFYAWLAVGFTLLMCFDKLPFLGRTFRKAVQRARETGELNRRGAVPLQGRELERERAQLCYRPHVLEFVVPLLVLVGVAVGSFVVLGRPMVLWAFGAAFLIALGLVLVKGLPLTDAVEGLRSGWKGVVYGLVVLLLAVCVGSVSKESGAGIFLVELIGERIPFWALPLVLLAVTMMVSFSTGTSFGTFAVALPLGMPLAWAVAQSAQLSHPELYLAVCFAVMINGAVFGDHCSPISDTTVLSCLSTECDLMDHVVTQLVPAMWAMGFSIVLWTGVCLIGCGGMESMR